MEFEMAEVLSRDFSEGMLWFTGLNSQSSYQLVCSRILNSIKVWWSFSQNIKISTALSRWWFPLRVVLSALLSLCLVNFHSSPIFPFKYKALVVVLPTQTNSAQEQCHSLRTGKMRYSELSGSNKGFANVLQWRQCWLRNILLPRTCSAFSEDIPFETLKQQPSASEKQPFDIASA